MDFLNPGVGVRGAADEELLGMQIRIEQDAYIGCLRYSDMKCCGLSGVLHIVMVLISGWRSGGISQKGWNRGTKQLCPSKGKRLNNGRDAVWMRN